MPGLDGSPADAPANDVSGPDIKDERHIDEACPCWDIGEIRDPQSVQRRCLDVAIDATKRAGCTQVADRRSFRFAPDHAP